MIRTIFTPKSNRISLPIPDKYIGTELEITVFPLKEISIATTETEKEDSIDYSFGAWADMDGSTEEICTEIRNSRTFRNRNNLLL
ncbi:MAG: hypothetical protein LBG15_15955 [Dysgonamonadaceae bacterium]|jgi:hypothetical protein|nr:hypothetical protein [Dysgonamonadaceae bacterium]